ncbi:GntR family transcriptional regulator [Bacillus thuringiensis]|uniref:GntR family transcriptional regulator n=1 Tax=Bacillus thuringiensis TaxID=1428 RepID=UPI000E53B790|nr:GntR family transcriptional regulator [Bacillus thuringiensis]MDZ3952458.1 GntR family transcriptional regulator [Bacillus thuringiensis]RGP53822.1 GntR family transcriptional regulator [Bacillus thuringiensis]
MPKKKTLEQQVYEKILQQVIQGEYPPGTHLTEKMLTENFNASRTPIRRALSRLESDGILKHESHCGAVVQNFRVSIQDYINMLEIRVQFLALSLQKAKRKNFSFNFPELKRNVQSLYQSVQEDNSESYYNHLSYFHELLLLPAQNALLLSIMNDLEKKFKIGGSTQFIYEIWKPIRLDLVQTIEQLVYLIENKQYKKALQLFEKATKNIIQFMLL